MKSSGAWVSLLTLGTILSGCGAAHGSHPISHGMTPKQVKNEVLARLKNWHSVSETVTEVTTGPRGGHQTYNISLVSAANPPSFHMEVTPKKGTPYEVVDNGLSTIEYQRGAKHYSVAASDPNAWTVYRMLGTELPTALEASRVKSVSVKSKEVVLHMVTPVASGVSARVTLWFDLSRNVPARFQAVWKGGSIVETPSNIQVNPSVSSSVFTFTPPTGVHPQVALTTQGTELDQAQARVTFPIVLPDVSQNLQLNAVNVTSQKSKRVVLLTYQTAKGNPVLITESKAAAFKPPAGLSMVTESVGTTTAKVGSMPDGEEMAVLTLNKTLVVVEAPAATVDALVNSWANGIGPALSSSP